jgi:hypothetical protein
VPDPVARRAPALHGVQSTGECWRQHAGPEHLGRDPRERRRAVRSAGGTARAHQLERERLLPDTAPGREAPVREQPLDSRELRPRRYGQGDIYLSRLHPTKGWLDPRHLRCEPDGPNSSLDEQGPSLIEIDGGHRLFFSRSSAAPNPVVPGELFVSARPDGGNFGPATAIAELNSPGNDIQPNVRKDGRELVFSSNHPYAGAHGAQTST